MFKSVTFYLAIAILICFQTANAQWVKQRTGSFSWFRDVTFVSASKGFIVGTDGCILTTIDGGTTWTQTPKFTTDTFREINFTDENTGWLLCERNIFTRGQNATSYFRKTSDGGKTWERIELENAGRERLTKMLFNKQGIGTAFGEGGIFYKLQEDRKTWKKSVTANRFLLLGGAFGDGANGAIVGAGGTILFTEDSGLLWDKATLLGNTNPKLNSVYFHGNKLGWAVGSNGSIMASTGGGRLWRTQDSGVQANLNDVFFLTARVGWAVGDDGTIIRTLNGGATWATVNSRVTHRLERIVFNGEKGWAVGFGGTVLTFTADSTLSESKPTIQMRN